jgi:anti-anti-sigma regulatory factor
MKITLIDNKEQCQLIFSGRLTYQFAQELENRIIDALRRYSHFEIDLSGVREIDICGIHLLGILDAVAGNNVKVIATSPVVAQAQQRLLAPRRSTWLRGSRDERAQSGGTMHAHLAPSA